MLLLPYERVALRRRNRRRNLFRETLKVLVGGFAIGFGLVSAALLLHPAGSGFVDLILSLLK